MANLLQKHSIKVYLEKKAKLNMITSNLLINMLLREVLVLAQLQAAQKNLVLLQKVLSLIPSWFLPVWK